MHGFYCFLAVKANGISKNKRLAQRKGFPCSLNFYQVVKRYKIINPDKDTERSEERNRVRV